MAKNNTTKNGTTKKGMAKNGKTKNNKKSKQITLIKNLFICQILKFTSCIKVISFSFPMISFGCVGW
jgi:hypothetical protein